MSMFTGYLIAIGISVVLLVIAFLLSLGGDE